jgi:hypothetical protein
MPKPWKTSERIVEVPIVSLDDKIRVKPLTALRRQQINAEHTDDAGKIRDSEKYTAAVVSETVLNEDGSARWNAQELLSECDDVVLAEVAGAVFGVVNPPLPNG